MAYLCLLHSPGHNFLTLTHWFWGLVRVRLSLHQCVKGGVGCGWSKSGEFCPWPCFLESRLSKYFKICSIILKVAQKEPFFDLVTPWHSCLLISSHCICKTELYQQFGQKKISKLTKTWKITLVKAIIYVLIFQKYQIYLVFLIALTLFFAPIVGNIAINWCFL